MPNPMAMESAPLMMMEAESRREKAMPQASSKMEEPVPVRMPEMICSVLPSKGDSAPDPSKRSVPVAPSSAAATRVGVACSARMSLVSRMLAISNSRP